jgi:hypothetical protein
MWVLTVTLLSVLVGVANAGNWYVTPTGGGNGTSWNSPWGFNTVNWATVQPGDTVWLSGGLYTSGNMNVTLNGDSSHITTIKRATAKDSACTSAAGWNATTMDQVVELRVGISLSGNGYVTIDGNTNSAQPYGILINHYGVSYIDAPGANGENAISILGIGRTSPISTVTLLRIEFSGRHGVNDSNNSWFFDCFGPFLPGPAATNIRVAYCFCHDEAEFIQLQNVNGVIIEHTKFWNCSMVDPSNHPDVIYLYAAENNVTIRYCDFKDCYYEEIFEWNPDAFAVYVYGNTFWQSPTPPSWMVSGAANQSICWNFKTTATSGDWHVYNNTFWGIQTCFNLDSSEATVSPSSECYNNAYYNSGFSGSVWGANNGYNFAASSSDFVDGAHGNFQLTASSSLRNKGRTLAADGYINVDPNGTVRSTWDVGAYQYGSISTNPVIAVSPQSLSFGPTVTNTSTNLTFAVQNTGGGTLAGTVTVQAPFSIVSGGSTLQSAAYSLGAGQTQTFTVRFTPTALGSTTNNATFTGGGGTTASLSGTGVGTPPTVSAITQSPSDVDPVTAGVQIYSGSTAQYSGSASGPNGLSLTWQWIYTINGGAEVVFQSGTGPVSGISYTYAANAAGSTYVWKLRVSNGVASAESDLTVGVEVPPPPAGSLTFQAPSGTITGTFVVTNGYIFESTDSGITNGGQAVYPFTLTNAGSYVIQALVNAPSTAANSFYINIDAQPTEPTMVWDIPVTTGMTSELVTWRGNGVVDANSPSGFDAQFSPKVFTLSAGPHQLVVVGREPNIQLQTLSLVKTLPPPQNVRILAVGP